MPQTTLPTRITEKTITLIDNILINNNVLNCISGNRTISISDHLSQFIVLDSLLELQRMKTVLKFYIKVSRISMKKISQMTLTNLTGLSQQKTMTLI